MFSVLSIFLVSFAASNEVNNDTSEDVIMDGDIVTDTLIQELKPWTDKEGNIFKRYSLTNTRGLQLVVVR